MKLKSQRGQLVLIAIVVFAIMLTMSAAMMNYLVVYVKAERQDTAREQSLQIAEAGVDKAIYSLNNTSGYTGESNTSFGNGQFTVAITSIDSNTKGITVTSYVPNSTNPQATRTIKLKASINTSLVSFRFGVQVGEGGAVMANNSVINGNLFSNGNVTGANGSRVTGDLTVAGGTQPTADQEWTAQNSNFNLGDVSARANVAQSFRPTTSAVLNRVSMYLKKTGSPGDITIKIVTDNSGKPSKTVLATGTLTASSVSTAYSFVNSSLSTSPNLTSGTTYWMIAIASVNASNYFTWGMDNTDGYTNGTGKYSTNWNATTPVWTSAGGDMAFRTYMGGFDTSMTGVHVGGTAWAHSLSSCQIDGEAKYQTISGCTVGGNSTFTGTDASPADMPISDAQIDDWEATAAAGGVNSGNLTVSGTQVLGPKEIDGNLTVNGTMYLSGPVWVRGNITFGNNSSLIVHSSTGNSGAVLIADKPGSESTVGTINMSNNITIAGNGNAGSYPMVLSTNTGASAITMSNNATGVILYAPNGTISVSNNAGANQITANTLSLSNNATVTYVNGLQSQSFSNGPGGSWAVIPGTYVIVDQ